MALPVLREGLSAERALPPPIPEFPKPAMNMP
jgi:hypothetical protein